MTLNLRGRVGIAHQKGVDVGNRLVGIAHPTHNP